MKIRNLVLVLLAAAGAVAQAAAPDTRAIEYYNKQLNHYFITSTAVEARIIDHGGAGPGWVRTGRTFPAWLDKAAAPADAAGVCRFYSTAANSHFYTASTEECDLLKGQEAAERRSSGKVRGWSYEGIAFLIQAPVNGQCPAGTQPVSRVYNNGFASGEGSNHRFVDDDTLRQLMVDRSWVFEGVVLCTAVEPAGTGATPTATDFSALVGAWSGTARWKSEVGSSETRSTAPLELVIAGDGAVSGSGDGCAFAGQVLSGNAFRSLFTGTISATGCANAAFNGTYNRFRLERYDHGTLAVQMNREDGATEAKIEALLSDPAPPPAPVGTTPAAAGIAGDWTGTVGWLALRREGGTQTVLVMSNRPLSLTISDAGAVEGAGFECAFTGALTAGATPGVFGGSLTATGCAEAAFDGTYVDVEMKRDDGKLEVEFEKETEAGGVTTEASVEGRLRRAGSTPTSTPPPIPGSYKGSFQAHIQIRDRSGATQSTTNAMVTDLVELTIAADGTVTGQGFGCLLGGTLAPRNLPERIHTGPVVASGCADAAMNGTYDTQAHTEGNGTLQVQMELEKEAAGIRTKVKIHGVAPRVAP
ncbi:MAG: hypothetical protein OEX21_05820 [Betaproteobacteria bacterium]|nr:hypothetical protein [Betaproteobacteria bacterium]